MIMNYFLIIKQTFTMTALHFMPHVSCAHINVNMNSRHIDITLLSMKKVMGIKEHYNETNYS